VSLPAGFGGGGGYVGNKAQKGDKALSMPLADTFRLALEDPDLRQRIMFVLSMFAVFALGVHIPVPVPGFSSEEVLKYIQGPAFDMLNMFGGGALRRLSIFSLGLNPYITASIIMQILQTALPNLKKEMQEGGEYARKQNNKRTRLLSIALCFVQGWGLLSIMKQAPAIAGIALPYQLVILVFWATGSMFMLWLGEQISERGIGNGVSLMIFAGIILSLPVQVQKISEGISAGLIPFWGVFVLLGIFLGATWFIVYFTTAQRRIPIQHMRRMVGTRMMGGQTSYLPLSVNMAGVLPIIFAVSLISLPYQAGVAFGGETSNLGRFFIEVASFLQPSQGKIVAPWLPIPRGVIGAIAYTALIFFFTYFWTAIQYNVEDISNNLKRGGSFIPGVRPGKQTKDFLDGVISRITIVGAAFIAAVALLQYISPVLAHIPPGTYISVVGGTSLLIMVSVALETMRQIEANLLMKQYGQ